jgi:carbonic anhydrase/acetyltransferase-like protein (isoleucine patch superfamily)
MGAGSRIAFPPGDVVGEHAIAIGSDTFLASNITLAAGMPGEDLRPEDGPVIRIGDRCTIGRGSAIVGRHRIVVEDDVTMAPNVYITDHNHTYAWVDMPIGPQFWEEAPVRIGPGCWLATGVVVLPGADIGRNVAVAAGSVVRGTVPDFSVVAGAPARVVRRWTEADGWVPPLRHQPDPPEGWPVGSVGGTPT